MSKQVKGFSLIEVLVALLLTTVGVLGMVALQGRGVQYTQDSLQRNVAVDLTNELIEIIRASPEEMFEKTVPKEAMNSDIREASIFFKSAGADFSDPASCVATASRTPQTAKEQRDCWASRTKSLLPGGSSVFVNESYICQSSAMGTCDSKGSIIEIRLAWQVRENSCPDTSESAPEDKSVCTYTVRVQP
jgi:type IV pilus assembly protein PilV